MIYLDNAATTYPKPPSVYAAVEGAMRRYGANPGRGGYAMAMESAAQVYACREELAALFGLDNPAGVVFTANCTAALNTVIKGMLRGGGHAVISNYEHNSVIRPLHSMHNVSYTEATVYPAEPQRTVESFRQALQPRTRLIICTHASNVFGFQLPIREIGKLAKKYHIPFVVDAAQSAGLLPLNMKADGIDFLCLPGHKALYGPMGTGVLLCRDDVLPEPLVEGGTGSQSLSPEQPADLPDRLESGTLNVSGICGLCAGVRFVRQHGVSALAEQECHRLCRLYDCLIQRPGIRLYTPRPQPTAVPMITLNIRGLSSEQTAAQLAAAGVAVRAGLHCAPSAHRQMGTLPDGAVRLCPSCFTTVAALETTAKILCEIERKALQSSQSVIQ